VLGLPRNTIKIGIMDEERRTQSTSLPASSVRDRTVAFINTGFLDRTGDEIHTSMEAGPVLRKADMKGAAWIKAYEDWNVDVGLALQPARPRPDRQGHVGSAGQDGRHAGAEDRPPEGRRQHRLGAVPHRCTLHALHYHQVASPPVQDDLRRQGKGSDDLLTIPLSDQQLVARRVQAELENNLPRASSAMSCAGWTRALAVQGAGHQQCRADGRPRDAAHLRPAHRQLAAPRRGEEQVEETLRRMAVVVDTQNAATASYKPMAPGFDSVAFKAAMSWCSLAAAQPNGYTEFVLTKRRREAKAAARTA
jgi:malate synthase